MLRQKDKQSDIVFQAGENLINHGTGECILTKNSFKSIQISGERMFESYVNEFCGLTGLPARSLRFQMEHREINSSLIITSSCLVKVNHQKDAVSSEFSKSMESLFKEAVGADIKLKFVGTEIPCHSYILSSRSPVFAKLLAEERKESVIELLKYEERFKEPILNMIRWIYTGDAEFSEDIFSVIGLLRLAKDFELSELVERCEEDVRGKLSAENVLDLLITFGKEGNSPLSEGIWSECKSLFLREFTYIQQLHSDLEERIASVPGLMSELFSHASSAKHPKKNRHVRFSMD